MTSSFSELGEASVMTPTTPHRPSSSLKLEDYTPSGTPFYTTPEKFSASLEYTQLSNAPENSIPAFPTGPLAFRDMQTSSNHNYMLFNNLSEYDSMLPGAINSRGIPGGAPSLDMDPYSPSASGSSQISADYVVPSQITFIDALEFQSPIQAVNTMQFDLSYDSPTSSNYTQEFLPENSPAGSLTGNMTYFIPQAFQTYKSSLATSHKTNYFRPPICSGLPNSAVLRHVPIFGPPKNPQATVAAIARRKIKRDVREVRESMLPDNIKIQKEAKQQCDWQGCQSKFQRKEHLRRHERTHLGNDIFPCLFCAKEFNRCDNLKQHVRIHTQPEKKASRTKYYSEALAVYEGMNSKKKKSNPKPTSPSIFD
jgi:zinc finger protein BrlA